MTMTMIRRTNTRHFDIYDEDIAITGYDPANADPTPDSTDEDFSTDAS